MIEPILGYLDSLGYKYSHSKGQKYLTLHRKNLNIDVIKKLVSFDIRALYAENDEFIIEIY